MSAPLLSISLDGAALLRAHLTLMAQKSHPLPHLAQGLRKDYPSACDDPAWLCWTGIRTLLCRFRSRRDLRDRNASKIER